MSFQNDTVKINEVVISSRKISTNIAGYKKIIIDSSILNNYSHATLGEMLSANSGIFIKSYGMGGTSTPSFRGTGANHTLVTWNGLNLNHPMLGQSDLSLIPAGLADDIQIYFGGASMMINSGGIGGIINLESKPTWQKKTIITINPGIGSFGRYTGLFRVKSGNMRFQTVTKVFLQSSENDFRYLNNESSANPVWETRTSSQFSQKGFMQEVYYRRGKNILSARIWYQSALRNLPSSMLTQQVNSVEKQSDESFRAMLNYEIPAGKTDFFLTGAFLSTRLNYSNSLASIDSRNLTETVILKTGMERRIGGYTKIKILLDEELTVIKSNNYDHNPARNYATLTASVENNTNDRLGAKILVREIFDNNSLLIPDFSAGLQFRIFDAREYFLKANISRNSKTPTLNDLFWVPGGNPDLKNEYAFMYELTYEMTRKISLPLNFRFDLSIFRNNIRDMIQWHPGEYSWWRADNIQNVNSMGLETTVILDYQANNFKSGLNFGYSFTKATTDGSQGNSEFSKGRQLMYIPENQANASMRLSYKGLYSFWVANLTGRRYITVDNSRYLPGYFLNNIVTGIKLKLKENSLDINIGIDNLFGVNYQTIAHYPLPGRSYFVKILVQLVK
jgi:vitamin B12 transporter